MRIAILGSSGFIGSELLLNLNPHYNMLPVNRNTIDLLDYNQVSIWIDKEKPDIVINCASAGTTRNFDEFNYAEYMNNIKIFINFYDNAHKIKKFINIGSGAEFDRSTSICEVAEESLKYKWPIDSYGRSKNIISRISQYKQNFYTLRLFGCFYSREPEFRLFKKFTKNPNIIVHDRKFDYIGMEDFLTILHHYIRSTPAHKDINCVYQKKMYLSEILCHFDKINNKVHSNKDYTGNGSKLSALNLPLLGLQTCIENYRKEYE